MGESYDYDDADSWAESEEGINKYFVVILSLLALVLVLAKFLHDSPKLASILPEAGMIIIVGSIAGFIIDTIATYTAQDDDINQFVADGLLSFSPKVFFFVLLPPIIFNSGYQLKWSLFFRHIMSISLFACFGTAISTMVVALSLEMAKQFDLTGGFEPTFTELLTFGALISATDPVSTLAVFQAKQVDPQLFYLVFGESVLNDAVGLVLFETLSKFVGKENDAGDMTEEITEFLMDFFVNFTGSMVFGVLAGIMAAYFLKKVDMRQTKLLELSLFFLIMYLPFFAAELVELSGIVTILFTGITAKRYASHNLSETTEENVDSLFRVIAHLAETSIFLELGLSIFGLSSEFFEWRFVTWAILACLLGRGCNVYPLRLLYNFFLANETVTKRTTSCLQLPEIEGPRKKSPKSDLASKLYDDDYGISYSIESIAAVDYSELKTAPTDQTETPAYRKDLKIRNNTAHMLFFSGLRGAVAYSCAKTFPDHYGNRRVFVLTTMGIVLFTVFVFGCTTDLVLNWLGIETYVDEEKYMQDNGTEQKVDFFLRFENRYIIPNVMRVDDETTSEDASPTGIGTAFSYRENYNLEKSESLKRRESIFDFGMNSRTMSIRTMNTRNTTFDNVGDQRISALPYYPALELKKYSDLQ